MSATTKNLCTKAAIIALSKPNRCNYVINNCKEQGDVFNFVDLYFCRLDENLIPTIIICVVFLFFTIRMLEFISDRFISPAISKFATYMKLSQAMAGATLLAFSNGATDVITALVASNNESDDLAVGSLFGASIFACTVVFAVIIWARPGSVVKGLNERSSIGRTVGIYAFGVGSFFVMGLFELSYWVVGTVLLLIYLVFVFFVWRDERKLRELPPDDEYLEDGDDLDDKERITELGNTSINGDFERAKPTTKFVKKKNKVGVQAAKEKKKNQKKEKEDDINGSVVSEVDIGLSDDGASDELIGDIYQEKSADLTDYRDTEEIDHQYSSEDPGEKDEENQEEKQNKSSVLKDHQVREKSLNSIKLRLCSFLIYKQVKIFYFSSVFCFEFLVGDLKFCVGN